MPSIRELKDVRRAMIDLSGVAYVLLAAGAGILAHLGLADPLLDTLFKKFDKRKILELADRRHCGFARHQPLAFGKRPINRIIACYSGAAERSR